MKLQIAGKLYFVDFEHTHGPVFNRLTDYPWETAKGIKNAIFQASGVWPSDSSEVIASNGSTICRIYEDLEAYKQNQAVIIESEAYCSPEDNFNKRIGRKVAFTKALATFPRAERAEWWARYFEQMPKDRVSF